MEFKFPELLIVDDVIVPLEFIFGEVIVPELLIVDEVKILFAIMLLDVRFPEFVIVDELIPIESVIPYADILPWTAG